MTWKERGKLSPEDIKKIIELSATKKPNELAQMFGVDRATIHYHLKRAKTLTWTRRKEIENKNPKGVNPSKELKKKIYNKKILTRGLNEGKSYKELLEIENEKRKKAGLYEFKISSGKRLKGL